MFLYRNDCIDGIMDTVLHIAQEMVCCNASFALRNYRRNNHTVTVELTNDETDFFYWQGALPLWIRTKLKKLILKNAKPGSY